MASIKFIYNVKVELVSKKKKLLLMPDGSLFRKVTDIEGNEFWQKDEDSNPTRVTIVKELYEFFNHAFNLKDCVVSLVEK